MLSCQKNEQDNEETLNEIKTEREMEILSVSKSFLSNIIDNMSILEGVSGNIDAALGIDRRLIFIKALKEITSEMEKTYE